MEEGQKEVSRELIHVLSKHSNISTPDLEDAFADEGIYADAAKWNKLLNYSLPGLGSTFLIAGIIFFFAFNWQAIPPFAKFGIIGGLLICAVLFSYHFSKKNEHIGHLFMALAFVLVGVLFAVFGQVYQTGADAYDLFIVWKLSVLIWTIVSPYPVIWLLFAILCNVTLSLYLKQNTAYEGVHFYSTYASLLNILLIAVFNFKKRYSTYASKWLFYVLMIFTGYNLTTAICISLFNEWYKMNYLLLYLVALTYFPVSLWLGILKQDIFYVTTTILYLLIIANALLIRSIINDLNIDGLSGIFFLLALLNVSVNILMVKYMITLHKKWRNETVDTTEGPSTGE